MGFQIVVWELRRDATAQLGYLLWRRKEDGGSGRRESREGYVRRSYQALMHHYGQRGRQATRQE